MSGQRHISCSVCCTISVKLQGDQRQKTASDEQALGKCHVQDNMSASTDHKDSIPAGTCVKSFKSEKSKRFLFFGIMCTIFSYFGINTSFLC